MPYDQELAERLRQLLEGDRGVSEKKMFGGLAFLVDGRMAITASGHGGIMVRVDPADYDDLLDRGQACVMEMRGRPMTGWLRVDAERVGADDELATWVRRGVDAARAAGQA